MNMQELLMTFMADFFVQFGANPTLGRLLGLLMCRAEPASLEELAEASGLSKASVSIHMRTLEQFEYCRRLAPGSDRRSYYTLENDFVATSYRRRLETQVRMLDRLEALRSELASNEEAAREREALRRLGELAEFQRLAAESSAELLEDWKRRREH